MLPLKLRSVTEIVDTGCSCGLDTAVHRFFFTADNLRQAVDLPSECLLLHTGYRHYLAHSCRSDSSQTSKLSW